MLGPEEGWTYSRVSDGRRELMYKLKWMQTKMQTDGAIMRAVLWKLRGLSRLFKGWHNLKVFFKKEGKPELGDGEGILLKQNLRNPKALNHLNGTKIFSVHPPFNTMFLLTENVTHV